MSKKNKSGSAFVYSTDPHFQMNEEGEEVVTLSPSEQRLKVILETKHRAGSAKDGEIILQGDQRDKATQWLRKNNFGVK
jgi:translation initiation factor 1